MWPYCYVYFRWKEKEMIRDLYVQTCRRCGLKQSAFYEHESECWGGCNQQLVERRLRSFEEVEARLTELESKHEALWTDEDLGRLEILKWVLGEME